MPDIGAPEFQTVVSVLIPTRRRPELLRRALASVMAQTHPHWEALVIDDGEGEGLAALQRLGDPRVKGWSNPGRGQVEARNAALAQARGEVIALLDDDDWWEDPYHLHRILRQLRAGPALVYRGGWLVEFQEGLEVRRQPFDYPVEPQDLLKNNLLLASGVAYPRALHDQLGPFDPEMGDYWDWDWYLRVTRAGFPLLHIPQKGVAVAVHGGNASHGARREERAFFLNRLCLKHGLEGVALKDHSSLAAERNIQQG
jgi:glycosyltransferase involved in cell wall biosynthesis